MIYMISKFLLFFFSIIIFFAFVMFVSGGHYQHDNLLVSFNGCIDMVLRKQWFYAAGGAVCLCLIHKRISEPHTDQN